eukprot:3129518-Lingulodinium_polyedra.AAC.1
MAGPVIGLARGVGFTSYSIMSLCSLASASHCRALLKNPLPNATIAVAVGPPPPASDCVVCCDCCW